MGADRGIVAQAPGAQGWSRSAVARSARRGERNPVGAPNGSAVEGPTRTLPVVFDVLSAISEVVGGWNAKEGAPVFVQAPSGKWGGRYRRFHRRHLRGGQKGGSSVGRCRAGKATKVMALADRDGLPLSVSIADGSRHDVALVEQTLDDAFVDELPPVLIGDKGFDSTPLAARLLEERQVRLIAPRRSGSMRKASESRTAVGFAATSAGGKWNGSLPG